MRLTSRPPDRADDHGRPRVRQLHPRRPVPPVRGHRHGDGRDRARERGPADGVRGRQGRHRHGLGVLRLPPDGGRLPAGRSGHPAGAPARLARADRLGRSSRSSSDGRSWSTCSSVACRGSARPAGFEEPMPAAWLHVIFWAGLRGAVAVAMALALPADIPQRDAAPGDHLRGRPVHAARPGHDDRSADRPDGPSTGREPDRPPRSPDRRDRSAPRPTPRQVLARPSAAGTVRDEPRPLCRPILRRPLGPQDRVDLLAVGPPDRRPVEPLDVLDVGACDLAQRPARIAAEVEDRCPTRRPGGGPAAPRPSGVRIDSSNPPPWFERPVVQSRDTVSGGGSPGAAGPAPARGRAAPGPRRPGGFVGRRRRGGRRRCLARRRRPPAARSRSIEGARLAGSPMSSHAALIDDIRAAASGPRPDPGGTCGRAGDRRPG